ncbi:hypothetical protein BH23GEM10_BH23GEM10_17350 [soil metagenome]
MNVHNHAMNMNAVIRCIMITALLALTAADMSAQQPPASMSLEDAIQLARRHSPAFARQVNDEGVADWNVRAAYANLLPNVSANGGLNWRAGGTRRIENIDLGLRQPDQMGSSYGLGLSMSVSGATFYGMARARAQQDATVAGVEAAAYTLEADVTRQYLETKRMREAVAIAERDVASAEAALELAEARIAAGAAARVDASQAIVEMGRAEVGLLQAQANAEVAAMRLMQLIGLDFAGDVVLTSEFVVFEPGWTLAELTTLALDNHPQLVAARAWESAGRASARAARMSYLPTLSMGGGWSGYTQTTLDQGFLIGQAQDQAASSMASCQSRNDLYARLANPLPAEDCSRYVFTADDRRSIEAANSMFPFSFTKAPPSFSMSISLPLFNGLQREVQLQQANAAADDASQQRRETELSLRTDLAATYLALQTAHRLVEIEARNVVAAGQQLELQQERYRLGAGSILELTMAQASKARADQAQLAALYSFHENMAALEAAVGRPLR